MNLNQLKYMVSLAQYCSFKEASKHCCVTQPTLSNGISQLESQLGGKLFKRTTRSVELTRFGQHILPLAQAVLEAKDELEKTAVRFLDPGTQILRIGMSPVVTHPHFNACIHALKDSELWSDVFLKQCFMDDMAARLQNDTIDLVLQPRQSTRPSIYRKSLFHEPLMYLPPQHDLIPAPGEDMVDIKTLENQTIILTDGCGLSDVIKDAFDEAGITFRRYPGQALSYDVVAQWADLGLAGSILPRSHIPKGFLHAKPLFYNAKPILIHYEIVWNVAFNSNGHRQKTIELLSHYLGNGSQVL